MIYGADALDSYLEHEARTAGGLRSVLILTPDVEVSSDVDAVVDAHDWEALRDAVRALETARMAEVDRLLAAPQDPDLRTFVTATANGRAKLLLRGRERVSREVLDVDLAPLDRPPLDLVEDGDVPEAAGLRLCSLLGRSFPVTDLDPSVRWQGSSLKPTASDLLDVLRSGRPVQFELDGGPVLDVAMGSRGLNLAIRERPLCRIALELAGAPGPLWEDVGCDGPATLPTDHLVLGAQQGGRLRVFIADRDS